ncbi:HAD family hydrolase [Streptomyces exfoliatus]|uniref:HAD family hydrolase n=1 Tax=Streptomyces exfoliatus TaxID=1905 RepID=UPI001F51B6B0|nr:HAD family hydrolase [Streptomyces exfoliatus]
MAPTSTVQLGVRGRTKMSGEKVLLVLDEQLRGHDTFLTAILHLDQPVRADGLQVRILTFDDVTVLSPLQSTALPEEGEKEWSGTLLLPHGLRPPRIPNDLAAAVAEAGIDPDAWSGPEAAAVGLPRRSRHRPASCRADQPHCPVVGEEDVSAPVRLVSLDVGYTLGEPTGRTVTQRLVELSALPPREVKRITQRTLHVLSPGDDGALAGLCAELGIGAGDFPHDHLPAHFTLWPGAVEAVARIAQVVPVVTLSNVSHWDEAGSDIAALLAPHIQAHHPSWRLGFAKPDPRAVQAVADRHGVRPAEVLHVGDSLDYDVRGALAAGAQALWITRESPSRAVLGLLAEHPGRVTVVRGLAEAADHIHQAVTSPPNPGRSCTTS